MNKHTKSAAEKRKGKVRKNCEHFGKQENQKTGKIMQIRTKATDA